MAILTDILTKQAAVPARIEQSLPPAAPKISTMLIDIASKLPEGPDLPVIPMAPDDNPPPQIMDIIQGIDDVLPDLPGVEPPTNGSSAARRAATRRAKVTPITVPAQLYTPSPSVGVIPTVVTRRGM